MAADSEPWGTRRLRVLILEDNSDDVQSIAAQFERHQIDCDLHRVEGQAAFIEQLSSFNPDVVLCDFNMPGFHGLQALEFALLKHPQVPFIMVSGELGEEKAIETIKLGATDYVLKRNLARLVPAIRRAIREKNTGRAHQESEKRFRAIVEGAPNGIVMVDPTGIIMLVNPELERLFGYSRDELIGKSVNMLIPEELREQHARVREKFISDPSEHVAGMGRETFGLLKDGSEIPVAIGLTPIGVGDTVFVLASIVDITERRNAEEQARKLVLMEQRDDFVATLTHDLKNPLLGFNSILESLLSRDKGPLTPEQAELLSLCRNSNKTLLGMIQNLLEVYRYEKDIATVAFESTDVLHLVNSCINEATHLAAQRDVSIESDLPERLDHIFADELSIRRVMQNLLDNALKFTPPGGSINVAMRGTPEQVTIEVRDTGPGISPEDRKRLFQRFWRGTAGKKKAASTGLGLYLCQKIVQAHHGEISCRSKENEGTCFTVTLPVAQKT